MPAYISLLRGINVGGNKKIKMADLRALYQEMGFHNTQTLLQSGNAIFAAASDDPDDLAATIAAGIQAQFGFESKIIIRTIPDFRAVIEQAPFTGEQLAEPKKLLVIFMTTAPTAEAIATLHKQYQGVESMTVVGREAYLYYPNGMGRSKLTLAVLEKHLQTTGTGRNWNTVNKLMALAASFEDGA